MERFDGWLKTTELIGLPIWIDRKTGRGTFQRFSWGDFCQDCWVNIQALMLETTKPGKSEK